MDSEFENQFPEFDRRMFVEWLSTTRTVEELLKAPLCTEIRAATPTVVQVAVDNDILPPISASPPITPSANSPTPSVGRQKRSRRPKKNWQPKETNSSPAVLPAQCITKGT
jgi:hypothetical protein